MLAFEKWEAEEYSSKAFGADSKVNSGEFTEGVIPGFGGDGSWGIGLLSIGRFR